MTDVPPPADTPAPPPGDRCATCGKPAAVCVCAQLQPVDTQLALLILQHPQEQDVDLGTVPLLTGQLGKAVLKVGLSWPNLAKALGRPADPHRWAVLYLGSTPPDGVPRGTLAAVDRKGVPLADQEAALAGLDGLVVLDGTWSQAKTLWWRNAWLLKLRRLVAHPDIPSAYGNLRREPRRESLSTLEAAAFALARLEGRPELYDLLVAPFRAMVANYRRAGFRPPPRPEGTGRRPPFPRRHRR
jgi:DTW domain-containing protein YfiP